MGLRIRHLTPWLAVFLSLLILIPGMGSASCWILGFSNGVGISQDKSAYGNLSADTIFIIISGSTSLWQLEIGNGWPAPMVYRLANDQNT